MAREGRQKSSSGVYHVLLRGVDRLFLQEADYSWFRSRMGLHFGENGVLLLAYLLLPNRVHLLIDEGSAGLLAAVKPLCTSYARYFNRTYSGQGKLFYDRFKSVPCETAYEISDTAAFFHAVGKEYAKEGNYSLGEYENGADLCDTNRLFELCGKTADILNPHTLHLDDYDRLSREELEKYLMITAGCGVGDIAKMNRHEEEFAVLFSGRGATARKLLPIFGVYPKAAAKRISEPKESIIKPEKPVKNEPVKKRDLSVWLL